MFPFQRLLFMLSPKCICSNALLLLFDSPVSCSESLVVLADVINDILTHVLLSVGPTVAARTADVPTNTNHFFVFLPKGTSVMWMKIAMTLNSLVYPHSLAHRKGSFTDFLSLVSRNHISTERLFLLKSNSSELNLVRHFFYIAFVNEIKSKQLSFQIN